MNFMQKDQVKIGKILPQNGYFWKCDICGDTAVISV